MNILEKVGLQKRPLTDLEMADIVEADDPDFAQWLRGRHAKRTAEDEAAAEAEAKHPEMSVWEARLIYNGISAAIASHIPLNTEAVKALDESKQVLWADHEAGGNIKPPRPPRRPNAPGYDHIALGTS